MCSIEPELRLAVAWHIPAAWRAMVPPGWQNHTRAPSPARCRARACRWGPHSRPGGILPVAWQAHVAKCLGTAFRRSAPHSGEAGGGVSDYLLSFVARQSSSDRHLATKLQTKNGVAKFVNIFFAKAGSIMLTNHLRLVFFLNLFMHLTSTLKMIASVEYFDYFCNFNMPRWRKSV